ncbi:restriction endonuclease subunit S [Ideonella sp.]|uniref:restriction endonuclease subunit S n=1 Tax=Ideonella sp. TaxID=1929293 RepID=UPI003BB66C0D
MSLPKYGDYKDSGVEWLGHTPSHWEVCKFRHAFTESTEKIDSEVVGLMLSVSGYRGIEVKEYDDENRRRLDDEVIGYRIVRSGQLVVNTMWLNYAGLGVSEHEGHVSPAYRSYWIKPGFERRFVHHMMRCDSFVRGYAKFLTGVRPNSLQMSRDDLMAFQVLKPPSKEQAAIAAFLDRETTKIDALIAEQEKLIDLLAEKRQATITNAVTKGLDPNAPRNDSGVAWLGEVPAHWEVAPLKRHWSVTDCKHITAEFVPDGFPLASIREVQCKYVLLEEAKRTTQSFYEQLIEGGRRPLPGDLIFSRNATVGEVAQVSEGLPPFAMGQDVCLLRKLSNQASSDFMQSVIRSSVVVEQLKNIMVGSTFKRVNVEEIRSLQVPVPPPDEQARIAEFINDECKRQDALGDEVGRTIGLLKEHRCALITAAVTGQIDVRGT